MKNFLINFQKFKSTIFFNLFCYIWIAGFSTLAFAPYHWTIFVWIAPFGLFWLEAKYTGQYKKLFYNGLIISVFFCTFSFFWLNHMFIVFGNFPGYLSFLMFILYSMVFNLKFPIFLISFSFLTRKLGKHRIWIASFCALLSEFFSFQIFPWYWGNLVAGHEKLAQTAEITGVYGLTFLLFIVSYAIFNINPDTLGKLYSNKSERILYLKYFSFPVITFLSFYTVGYILFIKWSNVIPESQKQILMIQPDSPLEFRDGRQFKETMEDLMLRIESLAEKGSAEKKPDLIVLPESGVPFFSAHKIPATTSAFHMSYWERFESLIFLFANKYGSNVFFNEIDASFAKNEISPNALRYYNSSVLYDSNGNRRDSYRKSYLLAFGEYIPLGETFEFLYALSPQTGRFVPGEEQNLITYYKRELNQTPFSKPHLPWKATETLNLDTLKAYYAGNKTESREEGKFLPLICYEVIIPEFVRKFHKSGNPDFIVNVTNDKWYGKSVETFEHLELGRLRSIEFRRWMVRSTSSGTSVFVDHLGRIVNGKFTGQETSEHYSMAVDVIKSPPTFYVLYGNLIAWIFLGFSLIYFIHSVYLSKKKA